MKSPTIQQLETAVEWLRCNEGDRGESEDCAAVAKWLDYQVQQKLLRETAREAGVSMKQLRKRLGEQYAPADEEEN